MNTDKRTIVFVGVGIKFYSHLTQEGIVNITDCDKLYYLVNEPATIEWLHNQNQSAESLETVYNAFDTRLEAYQRISQKLIQELDIYSSICVVMYGHPLVLNLPTKLTLEAISNNNLNIDVAVLPGISAESMLYCDLGIDPGVGGVQSYETTEFLLYQKRIDTTSHLVLWQIGIIGAQGIIKDYDNKKGIKLVQEYLLDYYPPDHVIYLYEASQYAHIKPVINSTKLSNLDQTEISEIMTLYVSPLNKGTLNEGILSMLRG